MIGKLLRNAGRVATNPAMAAAYSRWTWHRLLGSPLRVDLPGGGSAGGFATFSEYWTFRPVVDEEYALLKWVTKDAKIMGDIGANFGAFTIAMAKLAPQAQIYSFEPAPSTRKLFLANIQANGLTNVKCQEFAVCDQNAELSFTNQTAGSGNNSLVNAQCLETAPVVKVPGITLDHFCATHGISHFDFLKIDAEGAEPRIIRGAEETFRGKKIKVALIELSGYWLEAGGSSAIKLAEQIRALNYDLYFLTADGKPGQRIPDDTLRQVQYMNALLLPS